MKQYITPEQVSALTPDAQHALIDWFRDTIEWDDDQVQVYIPEEQSADTDGVFAGNWDRECYFDYPEPYIGKLKNHEGTILPLLNIGQLIAFLDERIHQQSVHGYWQMHCTGGGATWRVIHSPTMGSGNGFPELCDALWEAVKAHLEAK